MEASRQPQHLRALKRANRIRLARAALKRRIAAGEESVPELLRSPPEEIEAMAIGDLLMSQRRWGRARMRRLLLSIGVMENRPICTISGKSGHDRIGLTERQRNAIAAVLEANPPRS
jgi:hypothetical protein